MKKTNIIMLASLNKGKIEEFAELFKNYPEYQLASLEDYAWNTDAFHNIENGNTYFDNAFAKGKLAHYAAKVPTLSDDSGLEVMALEGKPGVFSARYATPKANQTADQANSEKLLTALKGQTNRSARFVCTLVFLIEGVALTSTGAMEGTIIEAPRGENGFGYDSIFVPQGSDKTFAEMTMTEKNKISHRFHALENMIKQIKEKKLELVRP